MTRSRDFSFSKESFVSHYQCCRPINWDMQFLNVQPLDVEIGSGLGEFLIRNAIDHPERNFVGIEKDWKRIKRTLRKIKNIPNIRVLQVDARIAFLRLIWPRSVSRIYSLFPCPWPKKAHIKHRLFAREYFKLLNNRLVDGGSLKIVTDYFPYLEWMSEEAQGTGFKIERETIHPQFDTKFEKKWCAAGQKRFYQLHLWKERHIDFLVEEDQELKVYFLDDFLPERFSCQDITGEISVIFKDFLFDPQRAKGMIHLVVSEPSITQHLWVMIIKGAKGWCVAKAEGQTVLPTKGVARAIQHVYLEAQRHHEMASAERH